jgi:hypothetical protein
MFKKLEVPFLKEFKEVELEAFTDSAWGSDIPGHREKIRAALQQRLNTHWNQDVLAPEVQAVSDLTHIPQFKKIYASIAHSKELGGFVISRRPVGFDIEHSVRVRAEIVERISLPDEVLQAPSPAHLWAAKEATYKALLHYQQPSALSSLLVGSWNQNTFRLLNDKFFRAPIGLGATWEKEGHIFAAFGFK